MEINTRVLENFADLTNRILTNKDKSQLTIKELPEPDGWALPKKSIS